MSGGVTAGLSSSRSTLPSSRADVRDDGNVSRTHKAICSAANAPTTAQRTVPAVGSPLQSKTSPNINGPVRVPASISVWNTPIYGPRSSSGARSVPSAMNKPADIPLPSPSIAEATRSVFKPNAAAMPRKPMPKNSAEGIAVYLCVTTDNQPMVISHHS